VQASSSDVKRSFESAFAELEDVVLQLEEGDLRLEQAISLYERGRMLSSFCQAQLDGAELRVTQLESGPVGNDTASDDGAC
jgi:exodeoxyribonuclease VII small subunit